MIDRRHGDDQRDYLLVVGHIPPRYAQPAPRRNRVRQQEERQDRMDRCDICRRYPGELLYWRFDEAGRPTAPPCAGLLICRSAQCRWEAEDANASRAPQVAA